MKDRRPDEIPDDLSAGLLPEVSERSCPIVNVMKRFFFVTDEEDEQALASYITITMAVTSDATIWSVTLQSAIMLLEPLRCHFYL